MEVFGRYALAHRVATGGMADVFLAVEHGEGSLGREVAIKRLLPHLADKPEMLRLFEEEARLLAMLRHPGIPQVYEFGIVGSQWFIAMEAVEGSSLAEIWEAAGRARREIPLAVALTAMIQACEAIGHAHEKRDSLGQPLRIVHCDLSPENLMLTRDGYVKVLDFGVAQSARVDPNVRRPVRGTLRYMSPEQVRARPLDKRSDVFSLGVVLYELTTGTRLYTGPDAGVMTQIVEVDPPAPSLRVPGYPPALERVVLHALARNRDDRLPSAYAFSAALMDFCASHAIPAGPRAIAEYVNSLIPRSGSSERRRPSVRPPGVTAIVDGPPPLPTSSPGSGHSTPGANPTPGPAHPMIGADDEETLFEDLDTFTASSAADRRENEQLIPASGEVTRRERVVVRPPAAPQPLPSQKKERGSGGGGVR